MPAAAVIPAPIAYIKVVAVKKLVVGGVRETRKRVYIYGDACAPLLWRALARGCVFRPDDWAGCFSLSAVSESGCLL